VLCIAHSEKNRRRFLDGARKGGRLRGLSLRRPSAEPAGAGGALDTVPGLVALVARTLGRLAALPLSVPVANAVGQLVTVQLRALEGGDFEQRLAALESALPR
jgi:hypothetical protein